MKVVINRCYGGFGLSQAAMIELIKRGSAVIEVLEPEHYYGGHLGFDWKEPYAKALAASVPAPDGYTTDTFLGLLFKDGKIYHYSRDYKHRADPHLVAVVEELGELASSQLADLRVVEIPDGIAWEIDEYDGVETIHETHRSWA